MVTVVREKHIPVSGALVKEKALEFAKMLNYPDFQTNTGWLDKFKSPHDLSLIHISSK